MLDDPYWSVNEVTVLQATKYHWYVHGLPMWPLMYQALTNRTSRLPFNKKPADWPSYGLATPIYYASKAWRDQVSHPFLVLERDEALVAAFDGRDGR